MSGNNKADGHPDIMDQCFFPVISGQRFPHAEVIIVCFPAITNWPLCICLNKTAFSAIHPPLCHLGSEVDLLHSLELACLTHWSPCVGVSEPKTDII